MLPDPLPADVPMLPTVAACSIAIGHLSPWGRVDAVMEPAPGIWLITTATHHGFLLAPERNARVPAAWRSASAAYDIATEWAVVCLTFPGVFTERTHRAARHALGPDALAWAEGSVRG